MDFPVDLIRKDFPILSREMNGKPLVYLDNAATTQKPQIMIDAIVNLYSNYYANIHRSVYAFSQMATEHYETTRSIIKEYINASKNEEIVFSRGTTEGINFIANTYGKRYLQSGDEILVTEMEHHSNIVPWQVLSKESGAILRYIPMDDNGDLILDNIDELINERTKIVSLVHISNSLGTINPIKSIFEKAKQVGAICVLDASQSIQHLKIDVQELDCDFLVFSGHKIYGPTGIGVLYGKKNLLEKIPPYQTGGDMIRSVSFERTIYADVPQKFEAGTQNIEGAIGLGASIHYVKNIGLDKIFAYEKELLNYATEKMLEIPEITIIGTSKNKASVISFMLEDIHPHDVGTILDKFGIAVRTGQHCTEPVMKHFGIPATTRASFAFYNTKDEINVFIDGIKQVIETFK
ncbi:MAG TPA: cysteine desulfurase [Candidatus Kapabacteria bacterium]|jgi:cysteine desulfurase/selenocysteine lyase|nr:cysteine desulfurase [Candidatus Kapabacteria bacterium]HOV92685.1 cysteine desulfurase [Candidatus Kapabacteria bacterium]